jgi:acyl-CoA dehydrogenase
MSENRAMLCDTAEAVFASADMKAAEDAGFASLLVPEGEGGFGGDWGDVFAVMRIAGQRAPDLAIGETLVSARFGEVTRPYGAFLRVAQTAGALDAALAMSIDYSNTRQQFGRPLSKFQAVQQNLAMLAVEAAAVNVAGAAAAAALDKGSDALFEIASAKLRASPTRRMAQLGSRKTMDCIT